jgi:hypothetical protein
MKTNFKQAKRVLGTNTLKINIVAVNGCCYGRENSPDKGDYLKYCGQVFWEFISGNTSLYTEIIEPLGINDGFDRTEIVAEGEDACWTDAG